MERSTVASLLRTTQALCGQLCDQETLEYGIAYYSERYADLPEANQFREVVATEASEVKAAFDQAEEFYRARNLTCRRWAPADGYASEALSSFLVSQSFDRRQLPAMVLARWVELESPRDVRVVSARAVRAAYRSTVIQDCSHMPAPMSRLAADAYDQRLDDPRYDAFVALVDNEPAGRCTLHQVGDIARVVDLCVLPTVSQRNVDMALLAHVLALARRLAMRTIVTQIEDEDRRRPDWFDMIGFVGDGNIIEFELAPR